MLKFRKVSPKDDFRWNNPDNRIIGYYFAETDDEVFFVQPIVQSHQRQGLDLRLKEIKRSSMLIEKMWAEERFDELKRGYCLLNKEDESIVNDPNLWVIQTANEYVALKSCEEKHYFED